MQYDLFLQNKHDTFLHRTHQYAAEGLDPSVSKTSRDACTHVTKHIGNNIILVNFDEEYVNIILS
jgi:hypothetical protein